MQEFSKNPTSRFVARRPALVIACAVFLVGGAAFAAAGGINLIKSLFVTVDIDGQAVKLELQPIGNNTYEGTMDTQIADGHQAKIHVKRVEAGPDQNTTQVHVNVNGDGTEIQNDSEIAIRKGVQAGSAPSTGYTLADLGDAEPVHEWTSANGDGRALYMIPDDDGQLRIFSVTTPTDGAATVRMVTKLPQRAGFEGAPEVTTDENDMLTLTWGSDDGDGHNRRVIKLMDKSSHATIDPNAPISIDTPKGEIKVKIDAEVKPDDQ